MGDEDLNMGCLAKILNKIKVVGWEISSNLNNFFLVST
jgi:hypothetical protein